MKNIFSTGKVFLPLVMSVIAAHLMVRTCLMYEKYIFNW